MVLIHGGPGASGSYWWPSMKPLGAHRTVLALDLRGHGESERSGPYSIARFVEDIEHVVRAMGHDHYEVLGHSFGASVALELAAHDARVSGVVLIGPFHSSSRMIARPEGMRAKLKIARLLVAWNVRRLRGAEDPTSPLLPALLRAGRPILQHGRDTHAAERAYVGSAKPPLDALAPLQWDLFKWRLSPREARRLDMPMLLLVGTEDRLGAPEVAWFERHVPVVRVRWFDGCGHSPFLEEPDVFHAALAVELEQWDAARDT